LRLEERKNGVRVH